MIPNLLLDTGVLGAACHPRPEGVAAACAAWLAERVRQGARVYVPEIADYELRRELLRLGKSASIRRLDEFERATAYVPITTSTMRVAAALWAESRKRGRPTAGDAELDGDMILAATARLLLVADPSVVVATTNVGHLAHLVPARNWTEL